jgi:hypothetical protein
MPDHQENKPVKSFKSEYIKNCTICIEHRRKKKLPVPPSYDCNTEPCREDCPLLTRWRNITFDDITGQYIEGEDLK